MKKDQRAALLALLNAGKVEEARQLLGGASGVRLEAKPSARAGPVAKGRAKTKAPSTAAAAPLPPKRTQSARSVVVEGNNQAPIITGDTHHHHHAAAGPDPAPLLLAYLQRLWKQCDALALLAGGDARHAVRLGAVYTALLTEVPAAAPQQRLRGGRGRDAAALEAMAVHEGRRLRRRSALDMLDGEARLVVLGGPGSGKSTFVSYVAQALAGERLGAEAPAAEPNLKTLRAPLPEDSTEADAGERKTARKPQPWRHGALMPVVVTLRDLAAQLPAAGEAVGAENVWRYLAAELKTAALPGAEGALRQHLLQEGGLVMFDGLDEVPDAKQRREQIKRVVEDFAASHGRCRILVTSRTYAYQKQDWRLEGFAQAPLAPFTPAQIEAFVRAWYAHMVLSVRFSAAEAEARIELLLRQVQRNPRVAELAERPLLLTLFARLQTDKGATLPEKREELYHASVDMLLNDWERMKPGRTGASEPEPSLTEWLNASHDAIRKELNQLAFEAHRDQADLQGMASIEQDKLVAALLRASPNPEVKVARLREYLRDRAGILVEHGVGMVQFPHRTFQEYLAACHLANDDYPDKLAGLLREEVLRWREVTLLAAAHAARGNAEHPTWLLAEELCPNVLAAHAPAAQAWAALLAGQVVVAAGQHGAACKPRNLDKLKAVRDSLKGLVLDAHQLPTLERALAGRVLAELGDPRPEVSTLEGMQFCWVPAGPFTMGSEAAFQGGRPHEVNLTYAYAIGRFPVTAAQWGEYLQSTGADAGAARGGGGNEPVVRVNWHEAQAFCAHLTRTWAAHLPPGWRVNLPSEAEWEKAARGGHQLPTALAAWPVAGLAAALSAPPPGPLQPNPRPAREWPWAGEFDATLCNSSELGIGQPSAVGLFAPGASPYGCEEMAGNVWEWTRSLWSRGDKSSFEYPYDPLDGREDESAASNVQRLVRGGSYIFNSDNARCAARGGSPPVNRLYILGFRVVLRSAPVLAL